MEGVSAQCALPNTPLCKSRLRAANLGHRLVCQAGGQTVAKKLGRGEQVGRKAPKPKVSGLDAMETATTPSTVGMDIKYHGLHHVGLLCQNLEQSLEFYQGLLGELGLEINPDRPNKKLPYRGAWLWIGSEMIHLMELPNPDPLEDRPEHGGRDRHICIAVGNLEPLIESLDHANVKYTKSMSGRPAIFVRDPDMNCLECVEMSSLE